MEGIHGTDRNWQILVAVMLLGVPGLVLFSADFELPSLLTTAIYGLAILSGAFIISWAAEAAEMDISASLAIAILVFVTVLPEYAIEAVLAWDAGANFDSEFGAVTAETQRVAANLTGANRLLIGFGWSIVILFVWLKRRESLDVHGKLGRELPFLALAALPTFAIFFLEGVHVIMAAILLALYVAYLWMSAKEGAHEPELDGIAAWLGTLPAKWRRAAVLVMFAYSTALIVVAADPFVQSLISTGRRFGVDDFILIQWIAPLASELPEVIVGVLFAVRGDPVAGISVFISSQLNKFTLLTGSMVVIFSLSASEILTFPLDNRQAVEFLLTAAVTLFGLVLIAGRILDWRAGVVLLALFVAQLLFSDSNYRLWFAYAYLGLSGVALILNWGKVKLLFREGV